MCSSSLTPPPSFLSSTGMQKREALNCRKIRHFGSEVVVETMICEP